MKKTAFFLSCAAAILALGSVVFCANVEQQVVLDENGVKVTITDLDEASLFGPELKMLIENNTDTGIMVQPRDVSVNDYMQNSVLMSVDVAAGKKANDSMTFMSEEIEKCGIEHFAKMEFKLVVIDPDTFMDLYESDPILIETTNSEDYSQGYDDSGELLFEDDSIKIVGKGLDEDDLWGLEYGLYIENKTDESIGVQAQDASINGFMVDPMFSQELCGGKRAVTALTFLSSQLEDNGLTIDNITQLELSFYTFDTNTYMTVSEMEPVVINIE